MSWTGVILAAGKGSRMNSKLSKVLHPVCGVPMVSYVAASIREAGVNRLVVIASPDIASAETLRSAVGDDALIVVQQEQLGTADALLQARESCQDVDKILVATGDAPLISGVTLEKLRSLHENSTSTITLLTSVLDSPDGLGRVCRGDNGSPAKIVEDIHADEPTLAIKEVNSGFYCFDAKWIWSSLTKISPSPSGEIYLTEIVELAALAGRPVSALGADDPTEVIGVNDRVQLAVATGIKREQIRRRCMLAGVTLEDPSTTYIDACVTIGEDTLVRPGSHLLGHTTIGSGSEIGPDTVLTDATVGHRSKVICSNAEFATIGDEVSIGPYSHLRRGTIVENNAYIGNFAEIKNSRIGMGTRVGHFSYVGDTVIGSNANIGAGTVTCNFDGKSKHSTLIGDRAFVGSGSMLVAPLEIGKDSSTGAGSVVTKDVLPETVVVGVPARTIDRTSNKSVPDKHDLRVERK